MRTGSTHTAATRLRMSLAHLGKIHSSDTLSRMSAIQTGKTHTAASKAKMSAAHTGKTLSSETRAKLSIASRGRKHSDVTRAKISAANKGRMPWSLGKTLSIETRARLGAKHKGKVVSAETRAKLSAAFTGRALSPETRARLRVVHGTDEARAANSARQRGKCGIKHSEDAKARMSARLFTAEHRRRLSSAQTEKWKNRSKEEVLRILTPWIRAGKAARKTRPIQIERRMAELLDTLGVAYAAQQPIGQFIVDFFVPSRNLVIEVDGIYWHSRPGAAERDARRDEWLRSHNYSVIRFGEQELKTVQPVDVLARFAS